MCVVANWGYLPKLYYIPYIFIGSKVHYVKPAEDLTHSLNAPRSGATTSVFQAPSASSPAQWAVAKRFGAGIYKKNVWGGEYIHTHIYIYIYIYIYMETYENIRKYKQI